MRFYFLMPAAFLLAAYRALIMSESFLRPAGVKMTAAVCFLEAGVSVAARSTACLRFIPSEIRRLVSALILRLFGVTMLPSRLKFPRPGWRQVPSPTAV